MLRFFRLIRQKLFENGNLRKYFWYALGEIMLVMIGILLALQVNNWNEQRVTQNKLNVYYHQLYAELSEYADEQKSFLKDQQELIELNKRTLSILADADSDSLEVLNSTIGAVATSWMARGSTPILDEFIESGQLAQLDDADLKKAFADVDREIENIKFNGSFVMSQYQLTIEPYFIRHINYQTVALDSYKELLVEGGPVNDLIRLKDDLEFWNIVTLKQETTQMFQIQLEALIESLDRLKKMLGKRIN